EMLASDAAGGLVKNSARAFYDRSGGEFTSVLSTLRRHTEWLGLECMADCLIGKSEDPRELKRSSAAWYVSLPAMRMSDLSGWLRLVVQLTFAAHEEEKQQVGPSSLAVLDEFNILGALKCVESAAGQIAGLGLVVWAVLQDLQQLQSKYPNSWETFIANAGILQVFGVADQTTADYVSKRLGESQTLTRSASMPTFDQATQESATGENWSVATHALLNSEEVIRYFARNDPLQRQLIVRPGYRPMICQRVCYDNHEMFRGRFYE
ncbi:MAG: type IV secretory system conjugative DNA transfer family protein, partial [Planctomycetota bacterium]